VAEEAPRALLVLGGGRAVAAVGDVLARPRHPPAATAGGRREQRLGRVRELEVGAEVDEEQARLALGPAQAERLGAEHGAAHAPAAADRRVVAAQAQEVAVERDDRGVVLRLRLVDGRR
jgi:hypothetical protein